MNVRRKLSKLMAIKLTITAGNKNYGNLYNCMRNYPFSKDHELIKSFNN